MWINHSGKTKPQQIHKEQQGRRVQQGRHCSTMLSPASQLTFHFSFFIFTLWGHCRDFVHLRVGANSSIHLCYRTVSGSDWDLQPFKMIAFLFCLFISLSLSLCHSLSASALTRFVFASSVYNLFFLLFSVHPHFLSLPLFPLHPFFSSSFLSASIFPTPSLWHETDTGVGGRQQSWWSANLLTFLQSTTVCVCVCGTVLDTGQGSHLLSCCSLWPKNHEWGPVDSWPGACSWEREAMDEIWTSLHHQTIWLQRLTVKRAPLQMINYRTASTLM